ncbi:uncharacterized protein LOC117298696 [Asterias rubens]|uniref:uncharacterized protein LOC117298696 n=1 Tax=Asterias rubens TaxID=7604 RepID=UPI0014552BFC|nr:uncharacterized protein LOC117298696 [Asterias rubens]
MDTDIQDAETQLKVIHKLSTRKNSSSAVKEFYDNWADQYDKVYDHANYNGPMACADTLGKFLANRSARIVDCAAGTGRVGVQLARLGFKRIDAVDFSQKSLDISTSRGVYERLICDHLGSNKIKNVEDGYYDGLICVGALSIGHLTCDVFPEWNRIVKKGGLMVFTLSWTLVEGDTQEHKDIIHDMQDAINDNIQKGRWELVEKMDISLILQDGRADMYTIRRM